MNYRDFYDGMITPGTRPEDLTRIGDIPHMCHCIGPQDGKPRCPCMMRNVKIENGRYVEKNDLGPVQQGIGYYFKEGWGG